MVVDGGITDVMQPIPMADTTGVERTPGTWQSTAQTMEWCGWTGRAPGTQWRRCPWRSGLTSQSNSTPDTEYYSSTCNNIFIYHVIRNFFFIPYISLKLSKCSWCEFSEKVFRTNDIKNSTWFSFIFVTSIVYQEVTKRMIVDSQCS